MIMSNDTRVYRFAVSVTNTGLQTESILANGTQTELYIGHSDAVLSTNRVQAMHLTKSSCGQSKEYRLSPKDVEVYVNRTFILKFYEGKKFLGEVVFSASDIMLAARDQVPVTTKSALARGYVAEMRACVLDSSGNQRKPRVDLDLRALGAVNVPPSAEEEHVNGEDSAAPHAPAPDGTTVDCWWWTSLGFDQASYWPPEGSARHALLSKQLARLIDLSAQLTSEPGCREHRGFYPQPGTVIVQCGICRRQGRAVFLNASIHVHHSLCMWRAFHKHWQEVHKASEEDALTNEWTPAAPAQPAALEETAESPEEEDLAVSLLGLMFQQQLNVVETGEAGEGDAAEPDDGEGTTAHVEDDDSPGVNSEAVESLAAGQESDEEPTVESEELLPAPEPEDKSSGVSSEPLIAERKDNADALAEATDGEGLDAGAEDDEVAFIEPGTTSEATAESSDHADLGAMPQGGENSAAETEGNEDLAVELDNGEQPSEPFDDEDSAAGDEEGDESLAAQPESGGTVPPSPPLAAAEAQDKSALDSSDSGAEGGDGGADDAPVDPESPAACRESEDEPVDSEIAQGVKERRPPSPGKWVDPKLPPCTGDPVSILKVPAGDDDNKITPVQNTAVVQHKGASHLTLVKVLPSEEQDALFAGKAEEARTMWERDEVRNVLRRYLGNCPYEEFMRFVEWMKGRNWLMLSGVNKGWTGGKRALYKVPAHILSLRLFGVYFHVLRDYFLQYKETYLPHSTTESQAQENVKLYQCVREMYDLLYSRLGSHSAVYRKLAAMWAEDKQTRREKRRCSRAGTAVEKEAAAPTRVVTRSQTRAAAAALNPPAADLEPESEPVEGAGEGAAEGAAESAGEDTDGGTDDAGEVDEGRDTNEGGEDSEAGEEPGADFWEAEEEYDQPPCAGDDGNEEAAADESDAATEEEEGWEETGECAVEGDGGEGAGDLPAEDEEEELPDDDAEPAFEWNAADLRRFTGAKTVRMEQLRSLLRCGERAAAQWTVPTLLIMTRLSKLLKVMTTQEVEAAVESNVGEADAEAPRDAPTEEPADEPTGERPSETSTAHDFDQVDAVPDTTARKGKSGGKLTDAQRRVGKAEGKELANAVDAMMHKHFLDYLPDMLQATQAARVAWVMTQLQQWDPADATTSESVRNALCASRNVKKPCIRATLGLLHNLMLHLAPKQGK